MTRIPAHSSVTETLADLGLSTIFGLMGDANMVYIASIREHPKLTFIDASIEGSAVMMAAGYQQVAGGVGVAMVTHGPGLTNTLTATTEAARARTPLLLITGDVPAAGAKDNLQRYDMAAFARAAEADFVRCHHAEHLQRDLRLAAQRAWSWSTPVVVDIPFDILFTEIEHQEVPSLDLTYPAVAPDIEGDAWNDALGMIASARRPLIVAGRGAVVSGAREVLVELGDRLGAVLGTSIRGKDLFHGEDFNLGAMGGMGSPTGNDIATRADVVIAFGAGLNDLTTSDYSLGDGRGVVHVDVDRRRIGHFSPVDVGLVGDAAVTARLMLEALDAIDHQPSGFRTDQLREEIAAATFWPPHAEPKSGFVDQRDAAVHLDQILPADRLLVTDVGRFQKVPWRLMHVDDSRKFVPTASFGSIGLGMPAAIGAAVARRDVVTAVILGDGGLMMNIVDFHTAVRYELPLVAVVMNDHALGAEHRKLLDYGLDPRGSHHPRPDFAQMARAMGGHGVTVASEADFAIADQHISERAFPLLIDIQIDPNVPVNLS